ncbi:hypothetical protein V2J09_018035 [Rumex salicifolius]
MSPADTSAPCFSLLPLKRKLDDNIAVGGYAVRQSDASEFHSAFKMSRLVNDPKFRDRSYTRFVSARTELEMSDSANWKAVPVDLPSDSPSTSSLAFYRGKSSRSYSTSSQLTQFFVKINGKSVGFSMNLGETVLTLHYELQSFTGIRVLDQRLIFRGKQLRWEQTLKDCSVERDSNLHLVSLMRSTKYPLAFQVIETMVSTIMTMCRNHSLPLPIMAESLKRKLDEFIASVTSTAPNIITKEFAILGLDKEANGSLRFSGHELWMIDQLKVLLDYDAPKALVALHRSPAKANMSCADECIRSLVNLVHILSMGPVKAFSATIILEFCRLLMPTYKDTSGDDLLYIHCRSALGSVLKMVSLASGPDEVDKFKYFMTIQDILPFLRDLVSRLKKDMELSIDSSGSKGPTFRDVSDFSLLLCPLRTLVEDQIVLGGPIEAPLGKGKSMLRPCWEEILLLSWIFNELCGLIDQCLEKIENHPALKGNPVKDSYQGGWSQYLTLLKELNSIAKLYGGAQDLFWNMMRRRKGSVHALIIKFAINEDDNSWLFPHKDMFNFESRRHLAMLMFPEVKEDYEELHEMLIDRSELLSESFEYISNADPSSLHAGLFIEFKNEEATGPGVMREWFLLVCQAIFNPDRALFVACPLDRRRFYPNPASKVDQLHLEYFRFAGRIIALALMHKVHIGIFLDRVLFLQLAEINLSLEDIKDADPYMYTSCNQILEMDPDFIDSDALGLTFVREYEVLGSRKSVELCPGGKHMIVNSNNRDAYVQLLIDHAFVKSITEQVTHFTQGIADILSSAKTQKSFFQCLELEDLDKMLHGSGFSIPVEDWKLHTDYCGYEMSDPQIVWLWEVIGEMSEEQKRTLLFFWTSVKYLPVEGFRGLTSRLHIDKSFESHNHLPSSHTCFFRLSIPSYPSKEVMRDRLLVITKEHVMSGGGCSGDGGLCI